MACLKIFYWPEIKLFSCLADLACHLYYVMLEEAKRWKPNKWYINDRLVESPHLSGFYARDPNDTMHEAAKYW